MSRVRRRMSPAVVSYLLNSISYSPTCSSNLCHQGPLGWHVGGVTSDLLSMTVQLWVHSLYHLGVVSLSRRHNRCMLQNTVWRCLCVSLSDSVRVVVMTDRVCRLLLDMHGHYVRACGGVWVVKGVYSSNRLHKRIRRGQHHGAAGFFTGDGCGRTSSMQKLGETVLDGVLLLGKAPWSGYGLHARPTG